MQAVSAFQQKSQILLGIRVQAKNRLIPRTLRRSGLHHVISLLTRARRASGAPTPSSCGAYPHSTGKYGYLP